MDCIMEISHSGNVHRQYNNSFRVQAYSKFNPQGMQCSTISYSKSMAQLALSSLRVSMDLATAFNGKLEAERVHCH